MGDRDARIRDEAYRMWVEAGRPDGDDHRYWFEAEKRVADSDAAGAKAVKAKNFPKPSKAARQSDMPDSGAAKAASVGQAVSADPSRQAKRKGDVEGAAAAPAPGPAAAGGDAKAKAAAREGEASSAAPSGRGPSKGDRVDVAPSRPSRRRSGA